MVRQGGRASGSSASSALAGETCQGDRFPLVTGVRRTRGASLNDPSYLAAHCMLSPWRRSEHAVDRSTLTLPPVILATTIPRSLARALREHAKATNKPRSEHLAAAIQAYLKTKGPKR